MREAVTLRPAMPADQAVLEHWDTQPHVIAAGGGWTDFDWAKALAHPTDWGEFLIGEVDGRPIAMLQIMDPAREEDHYWGDCERDYGPGLRAIDIWIGETGDLGRGFGTELMRQALDRCFATPEINAVLIDPLASNTAAHRFYERLGFRFVEDRYFDDDDCRVYRLDRADWV